jgi:hypothetical protein
VIALIVLAVETDIAMGMSFDMDWDLLVKNHGLGRFIMHRRAIMMGDAGGKWRRTKAQGYGPARETRTAASFGCCVSAPKTHCGRVRSQGRREAPCPGGG